MVMKGMAQYMYIESNEKFILIDDVKSKLALELEEYFDVSLFNDLINKYIITTIQENKNRYLLSDDINFCKKILMLNYNDDSNISLNIYFNSSFFVRNIKITPTTTIIYNLCDANKPVPAFIRNILYKYIDETIETCEEKEFELLGIYVKTTSKNVETYMQNVIKRKDQLERIKTSSFANSSSYMGSKKKLTGFIIEAMFPHCKDDSVFLDLMCGSGSISNALAQIGNVFASDAQSFCCLLAKIQGSGFNKHRAERLLKELYEHYHLNLDKLSKIFYSELKIEDEIFRMNLDEKELLLKEYELFIKSYNLYSDTYVCQNRISSFINEKKRNPKSFPYCLFTYYFANIYFGVAQSIQLDSIRYAIDQIKNQEEKNWALGVLVVVTSLIATTYGGHFAQPKKLDINSLEEIITQRSKSAWLEFSKRFITVAKESEKYAFNIETIKGPWENAINHFCDCDNQNLVVYLDAPYKREEYSRYYHVLETMVEYDYPASEHKGRLRSKKTGERFSTEFFSKNISKIESVFETIILKILRNQAICVWSYSNNGVASIIKVISNIQKETNCDIYIYSTPYKHSAQGKKVKKGFGKLDVTEYCIVFVQK